MGNSSSRRNRKLEKAIQGRKPKSVKRWIKRGADPNGYSKKSNYSFLSMAITLREEDLVHMLLKKGADPNQKSWLVIGNGTLQRKNGNDDEYPIHIAACQGNVNIMQALLNSKIDINAGQDHKLGTALHQAARFGHSKLTELLLEHGADIIGIDSRLNIPLHIAATYGQSRVAEVLLRHGSPINTSNTKSWTPLHNASSEGAISAAKLLLQHGADTKLADNTGKTPIDVAKTEEMLRLFLEHAIDDENSKEPTEVSSSVNDTGPPKPIRTFAYSINATRRHRTQSEAMQILPDSTNSNQKLATAKSYSDFGKWLRKHGKGEATKKPVDPVEDIHHPPLRRIKSVPVKKCKRSKVSTDSMRKPVDEKSKETARQVKSYPASNRETDKSTDIRHVPSSEIPTQDISFRRSKSVSAAERRSIGAKRDANKNAKRRQSLRLKHTTNVTRKEDPNDNQQKIQKNNSPPVRLSLSQSLHNLTEIPESSPSSPERDANFNIAPKQTLQRTKSEGRQHYHKRAQQSWIENQMKKDVACR